MNDPAHTQRLWSGNGPRCDGTPPDTEMERPEVDVMRGMQALWREMHRTWNQPPAMPSERDNPDLWRQVRAIVLSVRAAPSPGRRAEPTKGERLTWNEEAPTDAEIDGWTQEVQELSGTLHAALDRMSDRISGSGNAEYVSRLERAYNAVWAICRVRAALRDGGQPEEEKEASAAYVPYYCPCEICQKRRAVR